MDNADALKGHIYVNVGNGALRIGTGDVDNALEFEQSTGNGTLSGALNVAKAATFGGVVTINNTASSNQLKIARSTSSPATSFLVQATNTGETRFSEELSGKRIFTV